MNGVDRRTLLGLAAAALVTNVQAQQRRAASKLTPPRAERLPEAWTAAPTLPLWPGDPPGAEGFAARPLPADWPAVFVRNVARPALHVFRPAQPDGRALLVIPGGAYQFVSVGNEGVDFAARVAPLGVTVFVLTYRLPGEGWASRADVPLQDAQRAVRVIRAEAAPYGIDADTVAVLGFSAGGHVAATLATGHEQRVYADVDAADGTSARPFAVGLVYPVVTLLDPWTHELSRELLLGESWTQAEAERRSAELHVSGSTSPTFIVHALDDDAVPVENTLRLMDALRKAGRPMEAHLLQEGGHAFGTGYADTPSERWVELFTSWWDRLSGAVTHAASNRK